MEANIRTVEMICPLCGAKSDVPGKLLGLLGPVYCSGKTDGELTHRHQLAMMRSTDPQDGDET